MELNLNCDLGEKSNHYNGHNDEELLKIVNTANIACGYHAGNKGIISKTIKTAKVNRVSIGAHPGFKDKKNFGRKRLILSKLEIFKLVLKQLEIISEISKKINYPLTHVKPHGALNNMACEDFQIANTIGKAIKKFNKDLIYMVLPLTQMHTSAKKLDLKYACEIFADRNYNDKGLLIDRSHPKALIKNSKEAIENISLMIEKKAIRTISGKFLKTDIDSVCIHGDGNKAVQISNIIKKGLIRKGIEFLPLNKLSKFN